MTLMFTDVAGSVALKQRLGDQAYLGLLLRHNALFQAALAAFPGSEQIKATGDGFLARFASASAAVEAALSFQWALAHEPWGTEPLRVRIGIHVGEVVEFEVNGVPDVVGLAVDMAARVMSLALPGQILLTRSPFDAARLAIREHPAVPSAGPVLHWLAHSWYLFQGNTEPLEVFEVGAQGLAPLRPPPDGDKARRHQRRPEDTPNNLPKQLTHFVGRAHELSQLKELLAGTRVLTLTGSGGCGKTRLSLRLAESLLGDFPDSVWFADLASLRDPTQVAPEIRSILKIPEQAGKPVTQTVIDYLQGKAVLLVLDNCEHLLDACAALASDLVRGCPGLKVLATSQERLGIPGETAYRVPSLSLPADSPAPRAAELADSEAVTLFVERARLARPAFALTDATAPVVARICRLVDGIPLAIELVARAPALSLQRIADRLETTFDLPLAGNRGVPSRHQTLRNTIGCSLDLLTTPQRLLLQRLSVFVGGWTLEATAEVCSEPSSRPPNVVANPMPDAGIVLLLSALVERSLVIFEEPADGAERYRLLESVRLFAQEELNNSGGAAAVRDRHLDYFLALAEQAEPMLFRPEQAAWLSRLEAEHKNLLAALRWCGECGAASADDGEKTLRLAGALWYFWDVHGHYAIGRRALAEALAHPGPATAARARALNVAGYLAFRQGDWAAARPLAEESLAMRRALGEPSGIGRSLTNLGNILCDLGDFPAAQQCFEEALGIHRATGQRHWEAGNLTNLADVALQQGDYLPAQRLAQEGRALHRVLGNRAWESLSLDYLTHILREQGNAAAAQPLQKESLLIKQALGDKLGMAISLSAVAGIAAGAGGVEVAARLLGAAERLREDLGTPMRPGERARYDRDLAAVRTALTTEALARAWAAGRALPPEQAVQEALTSLT